MANRAARATASEPPAEEVETQVEEAAIPAEGVETQVEVAEIPAEGVETPVEAAATPAEGVETPAAETRRAIESRPATVATNAGVPAPDATATRQGQDETPSRRPARKRTGLFALYGALVIQGISALFFVSELWSEVLGLRSFAIPWALQEVIQMLASVGLVTGVIVSVLFVRHTRRQMADMRRQIDVASGNFETHLETVFDEWSLSRSEQDVAIYAMKGFSNTEIAALRGTSASTVKSQMNAIYRKAGLGNRQQLISCLVEDLLSGIAVNDRTTP